MGVDSDGVIVAGALTAATTADASVVADLVEQVDVPIERFVADGAYDGRAVDGAVLAARLASRIVVPPIRTATVAGPSEPALAQRDAAIDAIGRVGRRRWKKMAGYH